MIEFKIKRIIKIRVGGLDEQYLSGILEEAFVDNADEKDKDIKDGDLILLLDVGYSGTEAEGIEERILKGDFPETDNYKIITFQDLDTFRKWFKNPFKRTNCYDVTDMLTKGVVNINQLREDETLIGEKKREQLVWTNCDYGVYAKLIRKEDFYKIKKEVDPDVVEVDGKLYYKEPGKKVMVYEKYISDLKD